MRVLLFILVVMLSFTPSASHAVPQTIQRFETGRVDSITSSQIVVSGTTYSLAERVAVITHFKKNDSLYEGKGSLADVRVGTPVVIMVIGTRVYEIIIERWKR